MSCGCRQVHRILSPPLHLRLVQAVGQQQTKCTAFPRLLVTFCPCGCSSHMQLWSQPGRCPICRSLSLKQHLDLLVLDKDRVDLLPRLRGEVGGALAAHLRPVDAGVTIRVSNADYKCPYSPHVGKYVHGLCNVGAARPRHVIRNAAWNEQGSGIMSFLPPGTGRASAGRRCQRGPRRCP